MKELNGLADILTRHAEVTAQLFKRVEALESQQHLEYREINDTLIFFSMYVLIESYSHLKETLIERLTLLMASEPPEYMHKEAIGAGCKLLIQQLSVGPDDEPKKLKPDWFRGVIQGKKKDDF